MRKIKTSENLKVSEVSEANETSEGRVAPVASPLQLGGLGGRCKPPQGGSGRSLENF